MWDANPMDAFPVRSSVLGTRLSAMEGRKPDIEPGTGYLNERPGPNGRHL
jgi:hypothetical protein